MKEHHLRLVLPIVAFVSLSTVVAAYILRISKTYAAPPPNEMNVKGIVPAPPPISLTPVTIDKAPCLPTSQQFNELRTCTKQSDCAACSETPTSCIVVGDQAGVNEQGTLTHPVTVNIAVAESTEAACSGHGKRDSFTNTCVCDGTWDERGHCAPNTVCYTGSNCEVATFSIDTAGQYCLPSYLNHCDPYTSDTVLTNNSGNNTEWSCACKPSMAGLFVQKVEGGNCNVQIACGAPLGVEASVNVGTLTDPVFETRVVYPNRLTSYLDETSAQEPCVYKTSGNENGVVHGPAPDADPTCRPRVYTNKCTINTGGGNTQVIRGSNMPGDPLLTRVSPPFYAPVPPGLNTCPDGWSGRGTLSNPCTDPNDATQTYAFFTEDGNNWLGPDITSVNELRTWWVTQGPGDVWTTLDNGDVVCLENIGSTAYATSTSPNSVFCVDAECTAAHGTRARAWKGERDGPLLDTNALPHWITGGPYGGQCACDGTLGDHVAVPQYATTSKETPETWWACTSDACAGTEFPDATFNQQTMQCECNDGTTPPTSTTFHTGLNYKHPVTEHVCITDPCNPHGVNAGVNNVTCEVDAQCEGMCSNDDAQCYIPFGDGTTCTTDAQCTGALTGMSNRVAKCVRGTCATLDLARARLGSTCTNDAQCSLGACAGETGAKTCTGGCACAAGFHQESDGGLSPLGFTCVDDCIGKCLNGGTCVKDENGKTSCICSKHFEGERCEVKLCADMKEVCQTDEDCCRYCPCSNQDVCNKYGDPDLEIDQIVVCKNNVCQFEILDWGEEKPDCEQDPSYWTPTPQPCSGNGVLKEDGTCECRIGYTGNTCETRVCGSRYDPCESDADCCNNCTCPDGTKTCCEHYDPYVSKTVCRENRCDIEF